MATTAAAAAARPATRTPRQARGIRIHVLVSRLKLREDAYRDLIADLFDGKRSSTELNDADHRRLVKHLQGLADKLPGTQAAVAPREPLTPRQGKMFSLWQQLADAGLVKDRRMAALDAWIRPRTWLGQRVDDKKWLDSRREDQVIESLKRWLRRGVEEAPDGQA